MRRLGLTLAAGVLAFAALSTTAAARVADDGPHGVTITPIATGTTSSGFRVHSAGIKMKAKGRKELFFTSITVDPGGSFGWHSHPGPVLVAVGKGTLTVYDTGHHHGCPRSVVNAGDAFVENGGHVHLARNEGSIPVELGATFLARPGTTEFLKTVPRPAGCGV
jgi:quercetin dioxygenase-like cupin family protein